MRTTLVILLLTITAAVIAQDVPQEKINRKLLTAPQHIEKAGNLFISGGAVFIFSGILMTAGHFADADILTYAGAAGSGVGMFIFIGAGSHLKKAGKAKFTGL